MGNTRSTDASDAIYETRVARLRELLADRFGGKQAPFAQEIERQPDYVSRCLAGKKRIGEQFARHIEQKLDLPPMWMDRAVEIQSLSQAAALFGAWYDQLDPEMQLKMREVARAVTGKAVPNAEVEKKMPITASKKDKRPPDFGVH